MTGCDVIDLCRRQRRLYTHIYIYTHRVTYRPTYFQVCRRANILRYESKQGHYRLTVDSLPPQGDNAIAGVCLFVSKSVSQ